MPVAAAPGPEILSLTGFLVTDGEGTLGASEVDVNEQNEQAVGFYRRMGFEVAGRSAEDGMGLPFPLLHMRMRARGIGQATP